jgi:hypothetical protein
MLTALSEQTVTVLPHPEHRTARAPQPQRTSAHSPSDQSSGVSRLPGKRFSAIIGHTYKGRKMRLAYKRKGIYAKASASAATGRASYGATRG